ncbi:integral peroxisomal membrane peroxin-domain-containing protein [Xylariomycetidae sp. FL0641]|nr:integral peroxisomal membrane peroxin-domain-containing protein [Xylariomycetidae sp. FL0641]
MENYSPDAFVNRDEPIPTIKLDGAPSRDSRSRTPSTPGSSRTQGTHDSEASDIDSPSKPGKKRKGGLRGRIAAFKEKTKIQDQLVEKLLASVVPLDTDIPQDDPQQKDGSGDGTGPAHTERPNFTLPTMSNNFRRFNARIGVVFVFQARVIRLLSWEQPTHTLSFLAIYTFMCLDPYLLPLLPVVILLVGVLVPSFIARHPAPAEQPQQQQQGGGGGGGVSGYYAAAAYSPFRGPPLAPALTVRPVKELSRDFFRNMRDLQNCMEDFSQLHDGVVALLVPATNFSDEARSTALFVALAAAALALSVAAHLVPWRLVFLAAGWAATALGHPAPQRALQAYAARVKPHEEQAAGQLGAWVAADVILDSAPETREVEIFELQRREAEWEPWLFAPSPYDPLSRARLAGERPAGTRFFEDVRPPPGWAWSEPKWALDLWSREWVEERIITGVEIETEGERWVYDIRNEADDGRGGVGIAGEEEEGGGGAKLEKKGSKAVSVPTVSWEEGDEIDEGRRGQWRRRRWVRLVKRKALDKEAQAS